MNFLPPVLTPISHGIINGAWMLAYAAGAEEAQNRRETLKAQTALEPLAQALEQRLSAQAVDQALQAAGRPPIPSPLGWVLFLTPVVTYLGMCLLSEGTARSLLEGFQSQISTLSFVAFLVSQAALVYLTPGPQALASLIFIAASELHKSGRLPDRISGVYKNGLFALIIGSQIVLTQPRLITYLAFGASTGSFHLFLRWLKALPPEAPNAPGRLEVNRLNRTNFKPQDFEIHRDHIYWAALPHAPELNIKSLMDQWDKISWGKYPQASSINEAREELLKKIKGAQEIQSHLFPHMDLLLIAEALPEQEEAVRAELLWKLATDFDGQYSSVFARLVEKAEVIPFRKRVLQVLQIFRTDLSQKESAKMMTGLLGNAAGTQMPDALAGPVGAQSSSEINSLIRTRIGQKMTSTKEVDDMLYEIGYRPQAMVLAIQNRITEDPSFEREMIAWWNARFNVPVIDEANSISTEKMILAMLYDFYIICDKRP